MEALLTFFQNKVLQRIIQNSFWLTAAQGVNGLINVCLAIYVARTLGPSEFGKFAYALSFITLFATFFDFGLTVTVTKEFAGDRSQEQYFQNLLLLKSMIGMLTILMIVGISFFITTNPTIRLIIFILAIYRFFFEALNLVYAFFRARQKMQFEAGIRFLQGIGMLGVALTVLYFNHSIESLAFAYATSTFFAFIISLFILFMHGNIFGNLQSIWSRPVIKKYLLMGWYLALAQGAGDIMINTDSFLLGYWGMLSGVGLYNAAAKINAVVLFPMSLITTAILPVLIQALKKSESQFIQFWQNWMRGMMFFIIGMDFFVFFQAENIIKLFYGVHYLPAATTLRIMIIMAMIIYINNIHFQVVLIFNQQKNIFYSQFCGCLLNVLLNILLIPHWGINGAAVATIGGQLVSGVFYIWVIAKRTIIQPFSPLFLNTVIISIIAGIFMLIGLSLVPQIGLIISSCLAILIYSLSFYLLNNTIINNVFNAEVK